MRIRTAIGLAAVVVLGVASPASADLIEYAWAPGLVYDSNQDITILKDAGYAPIPMTWDDSMAWADGLEFESGGVVYDDWRLPAAFSTDTGPGVLDNEISYLFGQYGVSSETPAPFMNISPDDYWTSAEISATEAISLSMVPGFAGQYVNLKDDLTWSPTAWPVRDGAPVPEPATLSLLVLALMTLKRRR